MIGDVPVGYEDLVEVRLVVERDFEAIRYGAHIRLRFACDTENVLLTCRREEPGGSGKVRTRSQRLGVCSRGNGGIPCHCMSWKNLSSA